ncbi:MAG TPA: nitroreductase family deazaflavin-dependent oxidoreductase [Tetrasphaera sp.]|jgi:deazaflavin-dependent oxidoreductase (nitroreductase family)|uniref:Nitroreductase family deazaflavin-dependent oxidoreductase n=1 Tax=Nostocoides vanveenii TaxID=330835 RepID=A0ABN2KS00_9MICO|nr:nitroreductase family deazaflavin-dependent oxidoreductase [Tetrasphaera sp.]HNQ08231.1 nitroreductase family deazaflavin-dependent oxidoreductase [Tetrasphaera sp.]
MSYRPSPSGWVRDQVAAIEAAGDTRAASIMDRAVVLLTMTGRKSGDTLKVPLMRVEHDGTYAAVASKGGAPDNPQWYYNLLANPDITVQDGTDVHAVHARVIEGEERAHWWELCVAAFPPYAEYQAGTDRTIPVFVLERR